jgi:hypothetical protein
MRLFLTRDLLLNILVEITHHCHSLKMFHLFFFALAM